MQREVSKEEFNDWKEHTVTHIVFDAIRERQQRLKEMLSTTSGLDPTEDRKIVGMIAAYNTLLLIDYEDVSDE